MKKEDRGVERAAALAADERVRIAASDTIESLLETDFRLLINDTEFYVKTPPQVSLTELNFLASFRVSIFVRPGATEFLNLHPMTVLTASTYRPLTVPSTSDG